MNIAPLIVCNMAWVYRSCGTRLVSRSIPFCACDRAEEERIPSGTNYIPRSLVGEARLVMSGCGLFSPPAQLLVELLFGVA